MSKLMSMPSNSKVFYRNSKKEIVALPFDYPIGNIHIGPAYLIPKEDYPELKQQVRRNRLINVGILIVTFSLTCVTLFINSMHPAEDPVPNEIRIFSFYFLAFIGLVVNAVSLWNLMKHYPRTSKSELTEI